MNTAKSATLFLSGLLALVLTAFFLSGCNTGAAEWNDQPPPPQVSAAEVVVKSIRDWEEFTGRIAATDTVEIRPRVSGYIEAMRFEEGREVEKGDVLFVIDQRPYRAALAQAQAELVRAEAQAALAKSEAARARKLIGTQAISREMHDRSIAADAQAAAAVNAARAALDTARLNLEFTEVRAPINGRTGRALVTEGNLVAPGEVVLTTLVSIDPVFVYFEGDEQVFLRSPDLATRGEENLVSVGLAHEVGFPHLGTLDFIDNQVNPDTGTIRFRAVLDNPDRRFTPGLFARVRLQATESMNTMLVDERAILTDQDRRYVYILGADSTAQRRDVRLGKSIEGLRIVTAGLSEGDKVIVHGVQKIFFPGMPVQANEIAMGASPSPLIAESAAQEPRS